MGSCNSRGTNCRGGPHPNNDNSSIMAVRGSEAYDRSIAIDVKIEADRIKRMNTFKLLLLGTARCGKSTILKQMKILKRIAFSDAELRQQRYVIRTEIVLAMVELVKAAKEKNVVLDWNNKVHEETLMTIVNEPSTLIDVTNERLREAIKHLWMDSNIKMVYAETPSLDLNDAQDYFFDSIDRIADTDYMPNTQDILLTRIQTSGVTEITFQMGRLTFRVFDAGGQRSERRKWVHIFDDVKSLIFISAINEYDKMLFEDSTSNALTESFNLYDQITSCVWFRKTAIILFLNKKDLFAAKLDRSPLSKFSANYTGKTYEEAIKFMESEFAARANLQSKVIYMHHTCATDVGQVQLVLTNVLDALVARNMQQAGIM